MDHRTEKILARWIASEAMAKARDLQLSKSLAIGMSKDDFMRERTVSAYRNRISATISLARTMRKNLFTQFTGA